MIEPTQFAFNPETAATNSLMGAGPQGADVRERALREWRSVVDGLKARGVEVWTIPGEHAGEPTPDAVFPNN